MEARRPGRRRLARHAGGRGPLPERAGRPPDTGEVAAELGTSEGAVKSSIHRLRQRFGQLLRAEIGETVSRPEDVDDEVKHLLGVIAP